MAKNKEAFKTAAPASVPPGRAAARPWPLFWLTASIYALTASAQGSWGDSHWMDVIAQTMLSGAKLGSEGPTARQYSIGSAFLPLTRDLLIKFIGLFDFLKPLQPALNAYAQHLTPALLGAAGVVLFYLIAAELYAPLARASARALLAALALAFASPYWHHSRLFYSEGPQAVLLLAAFYGALRFKKYGSELSLLAAGAACGSLFALKQPNALLSPVFCLYWLLACRERFLKPKALAFFAAGILPMIALVLWSNSLRYGGAFGTGYTMGRSQFLGFATPLLTGLYGLFFSSGKSVFLYCPLLLVSALAFGAFYRAAKAEALLALGLCGVASLLYARWWDWSGDWAWGPRFLMPFVPCMLLGLGFAKAPFEGEKRERRFFWGLAALSVTVQLVSVAVFPLVYLSIAARSLPSRTAPAELRTPDEPYQIRDEQLETHFVPEFSPLLGNTWLLARLEFPEFVDPAWYPWKSLHEQSWAPSQPLPNYDLDFWWNARSPGGTAAQLFTAAVFALSFALAGWSAWRLGAAL